MLSQLRLAAPPFSLKGITVAYSKKRYNEYHREYMRERYRRESFERAVAAAERRVVELKLMREIRDIDDKLKQLHAVHPAAGKANASTDVEDTLAS